MPLSKIVQNSVDTPVAGTGPAFGAYPTSSSQTPSASTFTKVILGTEQFDTANAFNNTGSTIGTAPAYSFNPQVAGYYQINATVSMNSTATRLIISIYKNGSEYNRGGDVQSSVAGVSASCTLYLNGTTDYVELYTYTTPGGILVSGAFTLFSGSLVRAA